jgi:cytochrome P450
MTDFADRWGLGPDHFWLRGEQPKERVSYDPVLGRWDAYGYAEVATALSDTARFSANSGRLFDLDEETAKFFDGDLGQMTGPEHAHIRKQVSHAFSPRFLAHLEDRVLELATEYADKLAGRTRFDLLGDYADYVAGIVFSELLGIPAEDRTIFHLVDQNMDQQAPMTQVDQGDDDGYFAKLTEPLQPLVDALGFHVDQRTAEPRDDLLSLLSRVEKLDGSLMTRQQVINFVIGILGAGHLATPLLIGNTMLCLESFPDQAQRVRADRSLVPSLLDEVMRFLTPASASYRATCADVELGGVQIAEDQLVRLWLGAANRDPAQFPNPDTFDAGRSPNAHLGLGRGAHYCVGGQMVRVETRIVFNVLLDRFPTLRIDPETAPVFYDSPDFTGVKSVTVRTD